MEVGGLPTEKIVEFTLSTASKNDAMKNVCSKTSLDYLPLILWNSPFSKSDDREIAK